MLPSQILTSQSKFIVCSASFLAAVVSLPVITSASKIISNIPIPTDETNVFHNLEQCQEDNYYLFHYPIPMSCFFLHSLFNQQVIFSICSHFQPFDFLLLTLHGDQPFFILFPEDFLCLIHFLRQLFAQLREKKPFSLLFLLFGIQVQHIFTISEMREISVLLHNQVPDFLLKLNQCACNDCNLIPATISHQN